MYNSHEILHGGGKSIRHRVWFIVRRMTYGPQLQILPPHSTGATVVVAFGETSEETPWMVYAVQAVGASLRRGGNDISAIGARSACLWQSFFS